METGRGQRIPETLGMGAPALPQKREGLKRSDARRSNVLPRYSSREGLDFAGAHKSPVLPALTHTRGAAVLILPSSDLLPAPQKEKGGGRSSRAHLNASAPSLSQQRVGHYLGESPNALANVRCEVGVGAKGALLTNQRLFRRLPRTGARHD